MSDDSDILRQIQNGTPVGVVERNRKVHARFYTHAIKDDVASRREGRSIYRNVDYVQRIAVGDKDFVSAPVQLTDQQLFPVEWAAYQAWKNNPKTSIKNLPRMTPADYKLCEELEIFAIEDLAVSDVPPELVELKRIAVLWLSLVAGQPCAPQPAKGKPGRKPGSKNKPKATSHENPQAAA